MQDHVSFMFCLRAKTIKSANVLCLALREPFCPSEEDCGFHLKWCKEIWWPLDGGQVILLIRVLNSWEVQTWGKRLSDIYKEGNSAEKVCLVRSFSENETVLLTVKISAVKDGGTRPDTPNIPDPATQWLNPLLTSQEGHGIKQWFEVAQ